MNILLVADVSIAHVIGGAERVLREESTRLVVKGHKVQVLTRRLPGHEAAVARIGGVEERRHRFQYKPLHRFIKSTIFDCGKVSRKLLNDSPVDIINFHQPFSAVGVLSSPLSHRVPMVYTCHSLSFEEHMSRTSPPLSPKAWIIYRLEVLGRRLLESCILRRADHIVALSEYTQEKIQQTYGLPGKKISVIPGGADLERFRPVADKNPIRDRLGLPRNGFVLFTVRNLVHRMGLERLLTAVKMLSQNCSRLFLVVGGEGPLAPILREQVERMQITDSVRFAGYIPDEDLPNYYQMADLFILPTKELEGFGLVTVEALASGLPVLGTPVGGTKEVLSKLGPDFLFDDLTPEAMARGILKVKNAWAKDQTAWRRLSRICRQVAEQHYSWDAHVRTLLDVFQQVRGI